MDFNDEKALQIVFEVSGGGVDHVKQDDKIIKLISRATVIEEWNPSRDSPRTGTGAGATGFPRREKETTKGRVPLGLRRFYCVPYIPCCHTLVLYQVLCTMQS